MRILIALTYYRPHYSGLTIYADRLARALAERGHKVQVLTSRFDKALPKRETIEGVEIIRPRVLMRISKGVIMPSMPYRAWQMIRQAQVVNVHVPQLDAAFIAVLSRLLGKPVVMTYQCDLQLPKGLIHWLANQASHIANHITAQAANLIVSTSQDYAENSAFLRRYLGKVRVVYPSVEMAETSATALAAFRKKHGLIEGQPVIGMLARLATEKGVEYLVQALPQVLEKYPQARVLYAGQYENVLGEEEYAARLKPLIERLGERWKFLGVLPDEEMAPFFDACSVTVLPSLNSTEAFGIVQIESMSCGTPVVASDLPGVRQPVMMTGMGLIATPADSAALAKSLVAILDEPEKYAGDGQAVRQRFSQSSLAQAYEQLFAELVPGERRVSQGGGAEGEIHSK